MIFDNIIYGKFVYLKCVQENDSDFILSLRLNNRFNKYINKTSHDVFLQKEWIKKQEKRENDYYFIIHTINGEPIGTISLYNIDDIKKEGEFGRWICSGNAIHSLESALLVHEFGFGTIDLSAIYTNTVSENKAVINFHKRFGAKIQANYSYDQDNGFSFDRGTIYKDEFEKIKTSNYKKLEILS
ncbi:GNAT family N-acetyltransferase [Pectobacterium versatile]|uniref:GNAT family N-acetyltransferase n=1 Tax=Pectobacterium versatile TaxID=2488639 RepID=UPI0019362374|nr:GNAT family N-acetyltransferase [Pectobacterium versatile]MCO4314535.1 GNAT family N-acetyltransferase [Pectobacterium versatile]QQK70548.1 GNAT family N-acetyltransferase [Pectobacterium versatile]